MLTAKEALEQRRKDFGEDLGDSITLRVISENEIIYEEDCGEITIDNDELDQYEIKDSTLRIGFYEGTDLVGKRILECIAERIS